MKTFRESLLSLCYKMFPELGELRTSAARIREALAREQLSNDILRDAAIRSSRRARVTNVELVRRTDELCEQIEARIKVEAELRQATQMNAELTNICRESESAYTKLVNQTEAERAALRGICDRRGNVIALLELSADITVQMAENYELIYKAQP